MHFSLLSLNLLLWEVHMQLLSLLLTAGSQQDIWTFAPVEDVLIAQDTKDSLIIVLASQHYLTQLQIKERCGCLSLSTHVTKAQKASCRSILAYQP